MSTEAINMKNACKKEHGLLSLEASIALTIFIFLMLFMYSFFVVFEARNEVAHVVLSTANSLALDSFENTNLGESGNVSQIIYNIYGAASNDNNQFTDYRQWYNDTTVENDDGSTSLSAEFSEVVKNRFLAYLTDGNLSDAETILERYHIAGGVNGLDFSESHVSDEKLYIVVRYTLEYEFNVFGLGTVEFEQSACSKLW